MPHKNRRASQNASVLGKGVRAAVHWLQSTDTPRWWLIVFALLAPTLTVGATLITDRYKRAEDVRTQQIQSLVDSMTQFYVQAVAFSHEVQRTNAAPIEARNLLTKNLGEQFARLKLVEPLIPLEQRDVLERYRETILAIQNTLQSVQGPDQLGQFFTDASRLLVARNRLNKILLEVSGARPT